MSNPMVDELNAEHINPGQYPYCPHGSRLGRSFLQPGIPWNGPVGRCSCCFSVFGYIDEGSIGVDANGKLQSTGRIWTPKDRCSSCGGEYRNV